MKNILGREIPEFIEGYGQVKPFKGAYASIDSRTRTTITRRSVKPGNKLESGDAKLLASIEEAVEKTGLKDGMTVSFHHHLRNGDYVTNMVMKVIADKGIKDIHVAATGIFACHEPLVEYIKSDVITAISVNYISPGPVAKAITKGLLPKPAVFRSHGGRPRAVEAGDLHVDVALHRRALLRRLRQHQRHPGQIRLRRAVLHLSRRPVRRPGGGRDRQSGALPGLPH